MPGSLSLDTFSQLDDELDRTEGRFDENYVILFPGLSICYQDFEVA